jgi:hypothetical protein
METRQKAGAGEGYDRLIRVKMTRMAADPPGPGLTYVQIFVFRDNPLKYTDPDGEETLTPETTKEQYNEMAKFDLELPKEDNWNKAQEFFKENPDGAYYRGPGEAQWQQFENKKELHPINPDTAIFDTFLFLGAGRAIIKGISTLFSKAAVKGIALSIHGGIRVAGANAGRGGVLAAKEINKVMANGKQMVANNGTRVYLTEAANGKFNAVVMGERGLVTTMKNFSSKAIGRLATKYGWK